MTTTTQPKTSPRTVRRIMLISGLLLILFGAYLLAFLVPDVLRTLPGPEVMTLAHAAEVAGDDSLYATIEDGRWDCSTIEYIRGRASSSASNVPRIITRYTEIFLTDGTSQPEIAMLVLMSGEMDCGNFDGLLPTGYLTRMTSDKRSDLGSRTATFSSGVNLLEFCGYCGTDNSLIGLIAGIVLVVGGLVLLFFGFRIPDLSSEPGVTPGDDLIT
ncbi:MAG: hypothetical protein H6671_05575 [Anaerolineaceae bacterium]|nr:hypothetical protein [Anaerolineaceae bacterium]